jgi:hypothetical protein
MKYANPAGPNAADELQRMNWTSIGTLTYKYSNLSPNGLICQRFQGDPHS